MRRSWHTLDDINGRLPIIPHENSARHCAFSAQRRAGPSRVSSSWPPSALPLAHHLVVAPADLNGNGGIRPIYSLGGQAVRCALPRTTYSGAFWPPLTGNPSFFYPLHPLVLL